MATGRPAQPRVIANHSQQWRVPGSMRRLRHGLRADRASSSGDAAPFRRYPASEIFRIGREDIGSARPRRWTAIAEPMAMSDCMTAIASGRSIARAMGAGRYANLTGIEISGRVHQCPCDRNGPPRRLAGCRPGKAGGDTRIKRKSRCGYLGVFATYSWADLSQHCRPGRHGHCESTALPPSPAKSPRSGLDGEALAGLALGFGDLQPDRHPATPGPGRACLRIAVLGLHR